MYTYIEMSKNLLLRRPQEYESMFNNAYVFQCIPGNEIHLVLCLNGTKRPTKQQFKKPRTESRERGAQPVPDFTIRASNHQSVECFCYNVEYIVFQLFGSWIFGSSLYLPHPSLLSIIRHFTFNVLVVLWRCRSCFFPQMVSLFLVLHFSQTLELKSKE